MLRPGASLRAHHIEAVAVIGSPEYREKCIEIAVGGRIFRCLYFIRDHGLILPLHRDRLAVRRLADRIRKQRGRKYGAVLAHNVGFVANNKVTDLRRLLLILLLARRADCHDGKDTAEDEHRDQDRGDHEALLLQHLRAGEAEHRLGLSVKGATHYFVPPLFFLFLAIAMTSPGFRRLPMLVIRPS